MLDYDDKNLAWERIGIFSLIGFTETSSENQFRHHQFERDNGDQKPFKNGARLKSHTSKKKIKLFGGPNNGKTEIYRDKL